MPFYSVAPLWAGIFYIYKVIAYSSEMLSMKVFDVPVLFLQPIIFLAQYYRTFFYSYEVWASIITQVIALVLPWPMLFQNRGVSAGMDLLDVTNYYILEVFLYFLPHVGYLLYA